jgi:glycopeptide antibiotics resistance protein
MLAFNLKYGLWALLLFLVEVFIALFIKDNFVRPFIGDVLVIILIYCFLRAFWRIPAKPTILGVFLFACLVEVLQYVNIVDILGLQGNKVMAVAIGSHFDWKDIIAYGVGYWVVLWLDTNPQSSFQPKRSQHK